MQHIYFTKRQSVKIKNKSFTLLEIVFTITIIGILLAICLPVMGAIKLSARKVKDVSDLQKIAATWREYTINRGNTMNIMQGSSWSWTDYGTWFDGNKPAKFLHWNGEEYTTDIRKAVPNVAEIGNGGVSGAATGIISWPWKKSDDYQAAP
ncbi:MAG: type II secretion system GspH family protein [Puniceicoccales bacterium]|nr:type II secretion system GspH family protein [Puniceicoccales bacterium]